MRFDARYADLLSRAARMADADDPLPAELAVSRLLGTAWSTASPGGPRSVHQALYHGLVTFLAERPGRPALALLRAIAALGTPAERAAATSAADAMAASGVAEPAWADRVGPVSAGGCWVYGDVFGDQESVVVTFDYPAGPTPDRSDPPTPPNPEDRIGTHALVVLVDHNLGGIVKDMFCAARAERALAEIRRANAEDGPLSVLEEITPGQARTRLLRAFAVSRSTPEPPVGENARALWALAASRLADLPEGPPASVPDRYDEAARAGIVAEFVASPQARTLPDQEVAAACARLIVEYGCDYDGGNPLRVSPAKTELFLLYWLPRQPPPAAELAAAMPAVLEAWVRWAASGQGLSGEPLAEVIAAVRECAARVTAVSADHPEDGRDDAAPSDD